LNTVFSSKKLWQKRAPISRKGNLSKESWRFYLKRGANKSH